LTALTAAEIESTMKFAGESRQRRANRSEPRFAQKIRKIRGSAANASARIRPILVQEELIEQALTR
jgi:hypothetical protein